MELEVRLFNILFLKSNKKVVEVIGEHGGRGCKLAQEIIGVRMNILRMYKSIE